jgi:hypothetical protein
MNCMTGNTITVPKARPIQPLIFGGMTIILLVQGWLTRYSSTLTPERGMGYMLGIFGTSCMVLLLLYPLRKHARFMRKLPPVRHWFRLHMVLGIIGPVAILFHCNFQFGAMNSAIALFCMLLVAGSGVIGRYFYSKIHLGLYGQRISGDALRKAALEQQSQLREDFARYPELLHELDKLYASLIPDTPEKVSLSRAMLAAPKRRLCQASFNRLVLGHADPQVAEIWKRSKPVLNSYLNSLRRLAQLKTFERLFSGWHVLHLPIFFMMLITLIIHIWAVHSY